MISAMKLTATVALMALLLASTSVAIPLFDSESSQVLDALVDLDDASEDDSNVIMDSTDFKTASFSFTPPSVSPPPSSETSSDSVSEDPCAQAAAPDADAAAAAAQAKADADAKKQSEFEKNVQEKQASNDKIKEAATNAVAKMKSDLEEAKKKSDEIVGEAAKAAGEAADSAREAEKTMEEVAHTNHEMKQTDTETRATMSKILNAASAGNTFKSILASAANGAGVIGAQFVKAGAVCKDSLDKSNDIKKKDKEAQPELTKITAAKGKAEAAAAKVTAKLWVSNNGR